MSELNEKQIQELSVVVDMRMTDLWAMLFEAGEDLTQESLALMLRTAYVSGYQDAFTEPKRGELFTELGYNIPARRKK